MKNLVPVLGVIVLIGIAGVVFVATSNQSQEETRNIESTNNLDGGETNMGDQADEQITEEVQGYTLAEIAQYNTTSSCWMAVDGKVYDVTSYINRHPGGSASIASGCGTDATEIFFERPSDGESHSNNAVRQLEQYYIGKLI